MFSDSSGRIAREKGDELSSVKKWLWRLFSLLLSGQF